MSTLCDIKKSNSGRFRVSLIKAGKRDWFVVFVDAIFDDNDRVLYRGRQSKARSVFARVNPDFGHPVR